MDLSIPLIGAVVWIAVALVIIRSRIDDKHLRTGYICLLVFATTLAYAQVAPPPIPIQTVLVALALFMLVVSEATLADLLAGIMLHPIMAMTGGFMAAGALGFAGGYDAMVEVLERLAMTTPLGLVGTAVLLANIPALIPLPCGRITAAAFLPGVVRFGNEVLTPGIAATGAADHAPFATHVLVAAFIVNAAASCAPSRLGGIAAVGEGELGLEPGASTRAQQAGILLMTAVTALIMLLISNGTLSG